MCARKTSGCAAGWIVTWTGSFEFFAGRTEFLAGPIEFCVGRTEFLAGSIEFFAGPINFFAGRIKFHVGLTEFFAERAEFSAGSIGKCAAPVIPAKKAANWRREAAGRAPPATVVLE